MKNFAVQKMLAVQYNIPDNQLNLVEVKFQHSFHTEEHYIASIYPVEFVDFETTPVVNLQLTIQVNEVK